MRKKKRRYSKKARRKEGLIAGGEGCWEAETLPGTLNGSPLRGGHSSKKTLPPIPAGQDWGGLSG